MATDSTGPEKHLVVFDLASEAYGVDISAVREIIPMRSITALPQAQDYMEGVINLRGSVIPVVDLRKRLGLTVSEETADSRIVVTETRGQDMGMVVDAVTEVLRIGADDIEPPLSSLTGTSADYLLGIARLEGRLIILLDLEKVLSNSSE